MEFITVQTESGKTEKLEVIDKIDLQGKHYVIVGAEDTDQAYAYRVTESNGFLEYESVGAGREFDMILRKFNEIHSNS